MIVFSVRSLAFAAIIGACLVPSLASAGWYIQPGSACESQGNESHKQRDKHLVRNNSTSASLEVYCPLGHNKEKSGDVQYYVDWHDRNSNAGIQCRWHYEYNGGHSYGSWFTSTGSNSRITQGIGGHWYDKGQAGDIVCILPVSTSTGKSEVHSVRMTYTE